MASTTVMTSATSSFTTTNKWTEKLDFSTFVGGLKHVKAQPIIQMSRGALRARSIMAHDQAMQDKAFSALDAALEEKGAEHLHVTKLGNGTFRLKRYTKRQMARKANKIKALAAREASFQAAPPTIINKISIGGGPLPSQLENQPPRRLNKTPSAKIKREFKPIKSSETATIALITCLAKIQKTKGSAIEFIGKRATRGRYVSWGASRVLRIHVAHLDGFRKKLDCKIEKALIPFIRASARVCLRRKVIDADKLTHGTSGFVLNPNKLTGLVGRHSHDMFIVRGRHNKVLFDARSKVHNDLRFSMTHYGSVDQKFWKGFSETFVKKRVAQINHVCESNFDVTECGAVAALVCQTIFPCGRITCKKCADLLSQRAPSVILPDLAQRFEELEIELRQHHSEFTQVTQFCQVMSTYLAPSQTHFESFSEITRLMKDRKEAPATHITTLSEVLAKGRLATNSDLSKASLALLEIARYHKNRTENIKGGGLTHFRNKISSKSHINPSLMCDNQLDKNGNFIWGERGYHAKRFFANYFEAVDNSQGYERYALRRSPNCARKLAIGNLVVSTNFETMREQMKGEPINVAGVTGQCISKRGENYVYPCCCVTLEDGSPALSEVKMPTKNHLVLGNSGDHKYLDLPADINAKMYIARQGYCYVNIFLAMLVNVNEAEAKNFTKMVRDVLMDKLGLWPSIMDVATACYLLTVFHPETKNAELPQILVDHASKTMHVMDAYGSLTTGYHILKAGTVSQLIQFASDSLDSEMKHYVVGGFPAPACEWGSLKLLIRGVYRPDMMRAILQEEPYLLLLSVLSPTIIMALYNSGVFEKAVSIWIRQDMRLCDLATTLSALTEKVSLAKTLDEQMQILDAHASALLDVTFRGSMPFMSYELGIRTLQRIAARSETDKTLQDIGFTTMRAKSHHLVEKTFIDLLNISWCELTYREKFSAIWESRFWCGKSKKNVIPKSSTDLGGRYSILPAALLRREVSRLTGMTKKVQQHACAKYRIIRNRVTCKALGMVKYLVPDILKFINMLIIISLLLTIASSCNDMLRAHKQAKQARAELEFKHKWKTLQRLYLELKAKLGQAPTITEFVDFVQIEDPSIADLAKKLQYENDVPVIHQAKKPGEAKLEQVIAFVALIMMLFDAERSDCVHKVLMKLKNLTNTIDAGVHHQSIDDIAATLEDKNMTIDFEVNLDDTPPLAVRERTFSQWWEDQLSRNNTVPHYRTEGHFMEFTRQTAVKVANDIAHGTWKDILLRGAVGSGKSTGLPFHLSSKGRVLLLEPTRPLAENVCKQLRSVPFNVSPTLRMRGLSTFGSTPITIMTSGFALHYFAHNPTQLEDFQFILFDECHVLDSSAMAFRCLLQEYTFGGVVVKVSATPPGREVEFTTQYPVKIITEEALSFQQFVASLGSKANSDVLVHGFNILVYVSSYNEVDSLSKMLNEKEYKVTKVDGRTMKVGNVEITTHGTPSKPHFIVATNIIENGVTLDVDVVVDFGLKVAPELDLDGRLIRCNKQSISFGERIQRLGRVGRNKPGCALRIGHTEKGLAQIPQSLATEAAFLSFTYGLPVMTHNVSTSLLAACTIQQARTMQQFELSPFFMVNFVRYDGTMHGEIHKLVKQYKLRDSEVILNRLAIPNRGVSNWLTTREYRKLGVNVVGDDDMRLAFYIQNIPDKLQSQIWEVVTKFKGDAGFGRLTSVGASKIAYTLSTDVFAIPRTIKIIDSLIESEMQKQAHFRSVTASTCASSSFSLASISHAIRAKYAKDHTTENISILQGVKGQLLEFKNLSVDPSVQHVVREFGALECVTFQSEASLAAHLGLKGKWNGSLITRDVLILLGVAVGGIWMAYESFKSQFNEVVCHQGYNKRQRQKLKFRAARDNKREREVYGDDSTITDYFGSAYTAKGKVKGKTKAMGAKTRKFVNMYGYNPDDYSFVRFVDPLTGYTLDESPYTDINLVQEHFTAQREQELNDGNLERAAIRYRPGIQAYYIKDFTTQALKVDLTPHNPLRVCDKVATIAGFPEREFELRQSGQHEMVEASSIPKKNEESPGEVQHEGKSMFGGMRDYNPIASSICQLTNESDGHCETLYGLGFGSLIITNQHLFKRNNGQLTIRSHHGEFTIKNTTQLLLKPCEGRDIILIRTPKDFPPFPQKLQFRLPKANERICIVGSNFQDKRVSSTLSEVCTTYPVAGSHFWKHWISTKDGHCGLPIVSTRDGCILGLHSLTNYTQTQNYFASVPPDFTNDFLRTQENLEWVKHWKYNTNNVCWGSLQIHDSKPCGSFKITKLVSDLEAQDVYAQSLQTKWMYEALKGNLKAVAHCPSQLVTKHSVKGKCMLFETYLQTCEEARQYFKPLMGHYQKSKLNREAYIKDIMKYSSPIVVGQIDVDAFEQALAGVIAMMSAKGFYECNYVTDHDEIFTSLNMKAAVGALYSGKKRDFFQGYTDLDKAAILKESCERLFQGKMGIWNGSLKSELRPLEKVNANKTRTFTAAPIDTLLGGKTCVDDFNNQFYNLNLNCPWSVGMTKFHGGWNKLLTMLPDDWVYCDADGSQFDSSLSPYLINAVLQLRLHFMEEWDVGSQMLRNLYTEIAYTPISTPDGTIVKKFKGNNSGQPSTVVDNTLMVILAMNYTLVKLGIPCSEQDNMCRYFVNGDDLLLALSPEFEALYDEFEHHFAQLGLNYKFDSRTREKGDLWFMSHQGIKRDNMFIPKIEKERIVSILEWDRSSEPEHRMEAICASMIEAWGYDDLVHEIRKFYYWVLSQAPYNELAKAGKAPYLSEIALRKLYTDVHATDSELESYLHVMSQNEEEDECITVFHQSGNLDAGNTPPPRQKTPIQESRPETPTPPEHSQIVKNRDKDVDVGTSGTFSVPRLTRSTSKLTLPKVGSRTILNLDHLLSYKPDQVDISNTRSTQSQFRIWFEGVRNDYGVTDDEMSIIMNGLMVWCIENGTSPNINGMWVMMDGEEQVEYPIKPLIDHATPTFRQIMAHFSNVAEAYIEKRNFERPYMPRYGLQRNLTDMSLARYAFDFYEITSKTPVRAREAHLQMKAAALKNANNRLFGLDGNVGNKDEDTERHTVEDVNRNMHSLLGMRNM